MRCGCGAWQRSACATIKQAWRAGRAADRPASFLVAVEHVNSRLCIAACGRVYAGLAQHLHRADVQKLASRAFGRRSCRTLAVTCSRASPTQCCSIEGRCRSNALLVQASFFIDRLQACGAAVAGRPSCGGRRTIAQASPVHGQGRAGLSVLRRPAQRRASRGEFNRLWCGGLVRGRHSKRCAAPRHCEYAAPAQLGSCVAAGIGHAAHAGGCLGSIGRMHMPQESRSRQRLRCLRAGTVTALKKLPPSS